VQPLWQLSATQQAAGIAAGQFTAAAVMDSVLDRIADADQEVNAIADIDPAASQQAAAEADEAVRRGDALGPLHGVPVTIKVNVDVRGLATNNGVPAFQSLLADDNSPVVQNLLNAGAVIAGRTNTPEFSMRGTTDNPLYGLTRNPWDLSMSPGGSSGGAGAAAANGYGAVHHGNDIGGSLRFPATANGVATVKPGQGRIAAYNPSATAERGLLAQLMSVQGVICREVRDVRLATQVMMQPDPRDPWQVPMPFNSADIGQPLIGYCREAHGYPVHPAIISNLDKAATLLEKAGYRVEEIEIPPINEPARAWFNVTTLEIKATLDPLVREHGSETIQRVFDHFYQLSNMVDPMGYMAGIADRTRMLRDWSVLLNRYPLILTPFLMRPAYPTDYDETFEGFKDLMDSAIYSFGVNYLGLPAGNVPVDLVEGMPSGVQIIGQKWREDLILDAMQVIEDATGVFAHRLWAQQPD